jgi:hypothetical protein
MVYRALTEYLLARLPKSSLSPLVGLIPATATTLGLAWAYSPLWLIATAGCTAGAFVCLPRPKLKPRLEESEITKWLDQLTKFACNNQLEERSYSQAIPLLEECAKLRIEIQKAFGSHAWQDCSGTGSGKKCGRNAWKPPISCWWTPSGQPAPCSDNTPAGGPRSRSAAPIPPMSAVRWGRWADAPSTCVSCCWRFATSRSRRLRRMLWIGPG